MKLSDLLPEVRQLSAIDQRVLFDELAKTLGQEEPFASYRKEASFPVWSPFDSFEAAAKLQQLLAKEGSS